MSAECQDCYNDCPNTLPDPCVVYTGEDVPELGLCKGKSTLKDVESAIITRLLTLTDGTGVTLPELTTDCDLLSDILNGDRTLSAVVDALVTVVCSINTSVEELDDQVNAPTSFNTECLTVTANPSRDQILQALLNKVCAISDSVDTLEEDYVKASELNTLITQYLNSTPSTQVQYNTRMVPHVAYPYFGPLSNFDASGKGISSLGFEKVYLCGGNFGTPDIRGRAIIGAVANVPGVTLDSVVDPTIPANAGTNYVLKQKVGKSKVALTSTQNAPHTHGITDPGHTHPIGIPSRNLKNDGDTGPDLSGVAGNPGQQQTFTTVPATTGITINSSGNGEPHENMQPSMAAYFIMYLP